VSAPRRPTVAVDFADRQEGGTERSLAGSSDADQNLMREGYVLPPCPAIRQAIGAPIGDRRQARRTTSQGIVRVIMPNVRKARVSMIGNSTKAPIVMIAWVMTAILRGGGLYPFSFIPFLHG
jgi:hypothetical protein